MLQLIQHFQTLRLFQPALQMSTGFELNHQNMLICYHRGPPTPPPQSNHHDFFLELRRRAASHFIKIEKKVHREGESPQTKYQTHPHTYKTLHTQNKERPDHRAPNLRWCYKRPSKQLFELRSSSQAPQGAFICYGLQEHLGVRENTFKHARISMFPNLPSHQNDERI